MKNIKLFIILFFIFLSLISFSQQSKLPKFRGVWIATVKMLDYPSHKALTSEKLKQEFITIIDSCKAIGANAIVFQIRPAADAFYNSPYEPWSEWLTGQQGRAPDPYYDPLIFMIEETHKRGMEFHAWINPYRAIVSSSKSHIVSNHITKTKTNWFFDYGVSRYFDPGIPEVRKYIVDIISDIVTRYELDGIHFDDYFYPYPLRNDANKIIGIPDYRTFKKYGQGFSDIKDWRRNNVNMLIMEVHNAIKTINPEVRFGISPPGVWRNEGYDPEGSATLGLAAYDWIYADILLWLRNGWLDYVAPQLYWHIGHKRANFRILVDWWDKHSYGTDVYIGLNIHAIDNTRQKYYWGNPNQIPNQIKLANSYSSIKGFILYRYKSLSKNPLGIKDSLRNNYFKIPDEIIIVTNTDIDTEQVIVSVDTSIIDTVVIDTIPLEIAKIDTIPPQAPINIEKYRIENEISIVWDDPEGVFGVSDTSNYYIIYVFEGKNNVGEINSTNRYKVVFHNYVRFERLRKWQFFGRNYTFVITTVDNSANESLPSKPVVVRL